MIDPALALGLFALVLLVVALVTWPRRGVLARVHKWTRASRRIAMEDALKHLYKVERRGAEPSLESLAGALEASRTGATAVLGHLREAGLVQADRPLTLTDGGRAYALRIIRTHRLWERFLADRTGVAPAEWHESAEEREHFLSPRDVETLASRLGHPRYDPHGDPIPTAAGEIPAPAGRPLSELEAGDEGVVSHLEDEPREVYDRLLGLGLSPSLEVRVLDREGGRVRLLADGRTVDIDPVAAGNVTVRTMDVPVADALAGAETLADLGPGEAGEVLGLAPTCQGIQRRRLLDLGLVPGTTIRAELISASGDPVAYDVRGALIALRREQQRWVRVRRTDSEAA